ncbi:NAD(P)H-dependent oxidoreductase [Oryzomonas japonica]|uniref:NAD(P)H-dependent oxidoreductase n=1 Tax=Oryzomonas japonica TaxID=2603858 RepID=A0A7J4ZVK4_9BACT|nr:NAD(P)H-dependent oxidoreductase [Oryzomonas japonica]KAB0667648.1 NAD(P)H-dependent oxidoreductase [Oryzomonas japonica]
MKVAVFNGSPRKGNNASLLIKHAFTELNRGGIETMRDLGVNMAWLMKKIGV